MKWYWVVLIIIAAIVITSYLVYKNKPNGKKLVIDGLNGNFGNILNDTVIKKPCDKNIPLAAPFDGQEWCCINGNWAMVPMKGTPQNGGINSPGILAPGCEALTN